MWLDDYARTVLAKFSFLESEYHFTIKEKRMESYGYFLIYEKGLMSVRLGYEYMEERFSYILKDETMNVMFWKFFTGFDPTINWLSLMPKGRNYEDAINLNVSLLKKYGHEFLLGEKSLSELVSSLS